VGVVSVGFYLVAAWLLMGPLGYLGLVWADTAKQMGHALIMVVLIIWQVGMGKEMGEELLGPGMLWIGMAGLGGGLVAWAVARAVDWLLLPGVAHDLVSLLVAGSGGVAVYLVILRWARLPELMTLSAGMRQRLRR
jgi:putative peptidoglycan lipid II flippase